MSKILKIKLIMMIVTGTLIGGISIKDLSILQNSSSKTQNYSMKENYLNDVTSNSQKIYENDDDKDLNSTFDKKEINDNSKDNNNKVEINETTKSDLKKPSDNKKEQKTANSKNKNSNVTNNQSTSNKQMANNSGLKYENNNVNTNNQTNTNTSSKPKTPTIQYDRTTSIYTDDYNTLLRVEYYMNNKLTYYSVIEEYDATTKSYIEKIYQCNRETNVDPLIRTDVYSNGILTKTY